MTTMGGHANDAATENGRQVFLSDSAWRSVEYVGTHRDRISSTFVSSGHAFWYNAGGNSTINFNDSFDPVLFTRRSAFGAMTF